MSSTREEHQCQLTGRTIIEVIFIFNILIFVFFPISKDNFHKEVIKNVIKKASTVNELCVHL